MAIQTNISPYFDDFDPSKQYNRILFRAGRAVQARELTQIQSMLQNQIGSMGSNIFKEGTIINGVGYTENPEVAFVKISDSSTNFNSDLYLPTENGRYVLRDSSGLEAVIVDASDGFESQSPDLKTFFINYTQSVGANREFSAGATLSIIDPDGIDTGNSVTVTTLPNHVGNGFQVSITEGIIYKGSHFIYVPAQSIIVEKYSSLPGESRAISVGFMVEESFEEASSTNPDLYDNAQGFNNFRAPGADRLKLSTTLEAHPTNNEPDGFHVFIRYDAGRPTEIRNVTEFNSIRDYTARRTFEESGDYVVSGMKCSLEEDANTIYATVDPGTAYVNGYRVEKLAKSKIPLSTVTETANTTSQTTGVQYGQFFEYATLGSTFSLDGTRYNLYDSGDSLIGTCAVRNVESGRLYVYDVVKLAGSKNTIVSSVGANTATATTVTSPLRELSNSPAIFQIGQNGGMKTLSNITFTKRVSETFSQASDTTLTIPAPSTGGDAISLSGDFVVFDSVGVTNVGVTNVSAGVGGAVDLTLDSAVTDGTVYYDLTTSTNTSPDQKTSREFWVITTLENGVASLGVPDVYEILDVWEYDLATQGDEITSSFVLNPNQKDTHYDISYITKKSGEDVSVTTVAVRAKAFERTSLSSSGLLTIDSYPDSEIENILNYTSSFGVLYDLRNSYDFRPYVEPNVIYANSLLSAETAEPYSDIADGVFTKVITSNNTPSNNSQITSDPELNLKRIDSLVVQPDGFLNIVNGVPAAAPSPAKAYDGLVLAEIEIQSPTLNGPYRTRLRNVATQGYTMKDIARIDRLTELLAESETLTLLEKKTSDLLVLDESGNPRFKNGFFVDPFRNLKISDITNPEFKASLDRSRQIMNPAVTQIPVSLKVNTDISTYQNVQIFDDVVTLGGVTESSFITQPYASNTRNAVSNFYMYRGKGQINPPYDPGYDVVNAPDVVIDIDMETPLTSLLDNLQDFLPVNRVSRQITGVRRITDVVRNGGSTTTTTTNLFRGIDTIATLGVETGLNEDRVVGEYVSDVMFQPFIQSQEIQILIHGLRPNTEHYVYFDKIDMASNTRPGYVSVDSSTDTITADMVFSSGDNGDSIVTDANGTLYAIMTIPETTFFVGKRNIEVTDSSIYADIKSSGTSYCKVEFNAYNVDTTKQNLVTSTRVPEFVVNTEEVASSWTTTTTTTVNRPMNEGEVNPRVGEARENENSGYQDPIAQTFFVKSSQTGDTGYVYLSTIDLYFQRKSASRGVTVEIREVVNGYPSMTILPFGKVHLRNGQISVSDNATVPTNVNFGNPVKLVAEREYAIVVIPDANDPDFLMWTARVGETDTLNRSITQDWGDGVLFTSTNNSAWKSYQDEDLKFTVYKYVFDSETESYCELRPDDYEFLTIEANVGHFARNEIVYRSTGTTYATASISGRTVTISGSTTLANGDYVKVTHSGTDYISRIVDDVVYDGAGDQTTVTIEKNFGISGAVTCEILVAGIVDLYNPRKKNRLVLKKSSAKTGNVFASGQSLIGDVSGATADIVSVDDIEVSYIMPIIYQNNTNLTKSNVYLYDGATLDREIATNSEAFLQRTLRTIDSKSNYVDSDQTFLIRYKLTSANQNNTPILDHKMSGMYANQYQILPEGNESDTSAYISSKVKLQNDIDGTGLVVIFDAHRPKGSAIKVYGRFVYKYNEDEVSDWVELVDQSPESYSSTIQDRDFKEFRYELDESGADEHISFQIKIVYLGDTINLAPAIRNLRAISVT